MKRLISSFLIFITFFFLLNCQEKKAVTSTESDTTKAVVTSDNLQAEQVINAFRADELPLKNLTVYQSNNDPNKLLGRPNQYIEKANWKGDEEIENHTIEVFNNSDDLQARKKYVDGVTKSMSALAEYSYAHKNVLLRLHHNLTPEMAAKYELALKKL